MTNPLLAPFGRRFISTVVGAFMVSLLSGCFVISEQPLSDPKTARADPALVGQWRSISVAGDSVGRIRFDRHGRGFMEDKMPNGRWKIDKTDGGFFITRTARGQYMNGPVENGYTFSRYQVSADGQRLIMWAPRAEFFRRAVLEGQLKGQLVKERSTFGTASAGEDNRAVILQDSPARMLAFIESQPRRAVFGIANVLQRVK